MEYCIVGETTLLCSDPRLDEIKRDYSLGFKDAKNRVCTRAKDWADVMARLATCEALIEP